MIFIKILISICIYLTSFLPISNTKEIQKIYIRGVRCNYSQTYIHPNVSCFAKSYSRTISTINVIATMKFPLNNMFVEAKLFFKYGTIYREVMHTPRVDWCNLSKDHANNGMVKLLIDLVNDATPGLVHPCPYLEFNVRNASVKTSALVSIFATGDYKIIFFSSDEKGEEMVVVNIIGSMDSSNKDTFG